MKKYIAYAIASGLLLTAGWPSHGFPLLLFIAFVPLLLTEHQISQRAEFKKKGRKIFGLSFLAFIIWNAIVIWWLHFAKETDANGDLQNSWLAYLIPVIANAFFMSIVFQIYHWVKTKAGNIYGLVFLPAIWISFEKLHLNWELTWPWFNLGNGFAKWYEWVQWYEYTGTFGGTLWIWVTNLVIFYYLTAYINKKEINYLNKLGIFGGLLIAVPIGISYIIYANYEEKGKALHALILQPDLDPYNEKYMKDGLQIYDELKQLAVKNMQPNTQFVVAPETAIPGSSALVFDNLYNDLIIQDIQQWTNSKKDLHFVTGASVMRIYPVASLATESASVMKDGITWYDAYNSALQLGSNDSIQIYHKSKLVPGVENFPYRSFLMPIIGEFMLNFGGTTKTLGTQPNRSVFKNKTNAAAVAPIICYESIYGEYTTEYVREGANVLFTMTNDSWWGSTDGHRQLLLYGNLRAIENRRAIVRSANSGVSAFVNQRGDIMKSLPYGEQGALNGTVLMNSELTFYTKYGDVLARVALLIMGIILAYTLAQKLLYKQVKKKNIK
ncbi:apolipoprotein N-acyltransferase [Algoriella xinjiangensis]|uniref:Apolipoprotein N-acyltransferase n=1 Tax=Algoriella xinjiangensis TaxID=684065 RepID=A0A1I4VN28_9FLAO|nr:MULTISPECIES: apolipoprotein N-acyltransferase [Algoriella]MBO6213004.1 apolipoprotein N-acyltransferase [Algoriella sp.]SFN02529.1 apolipoprotein N-acyltransferase [Algoriella xinjiangensis]VDH17254.1 Apolipoprotein N-acyltransferase [Algoriella xinjiangensis]